MEAFDFVLLKNAICIRIKPYFKFQRVFQRIHYDSLRFITIHYDKKKWLHQTNDEMQIRVVLDTLVSESSGCYIIIHVQLMSYFSSDYAMVFLLLISFQAMESKR
jgi:calcineurin-like phosphoesterase family protein